MKKTALVSFATLTLSQPRISLAASWTLLSNPAPSILTLQDFIYWLIEIMQLVGIPALACCIIYAGFQFVTAGGDEAQVTKAKIWLTWTLVGGLIILGAKVIADMVYGTAILF
ncbi:MAG: hypothetical protein A2845_02950 [Candidatus Lloydbacteria bacterium RIFCSPHIGHO2_01_FULL_49_22]|uniref:Conjugal transfer protein TrbC n=1 Tax=Candidatus Lloydbacteria bacterium RIFCSPHIGHO2_01_FULL_49_22 TaxID=1798658 RepID=A0A1G2CVF8_9BACT|nr:MAG: hypothetical protein A2845_02950 [Candidatus Lloydbacteria bacterium RIFCSPHIGHO2_01_FULL_49_22]OGZ10399.1 MAG: hypothetical protein A3C14_02650 [Candidatus Lloydbacteria bacterium RIFCSPHIGHO2_02_FULL_50_18]